MRPATRVTTLLLLTVTAVSFACGRPGGQQGGAPSGAEKKKDVTLVRTVKPLRGRFDSRLPFTADVKAFDHADIMPKSSGVVRVVRVEEGQHVVKNDIIAELENDQQLINRDLQKLTVREAEIGLDSSGKMLDEAEAAGRACDDKVAHQKNLLDRAQKQKREEIVAVNEVEVAEFNYKQALSEKERQVVTIATRKTDVAAAKLALEKARQQLKTAELNLEWTHIRASLDGHIVRQHLRAGQNAQMTSAAFTISDLDSLVLLPEISQIELQRLRTGLDARVTSTAYPDIEFNGKIEFISPEVDSGHGTVTVRIRMGKSDPPLLPGMFVSGHIITESREDVLQIPKKALLFSGDRPYVYVVETLDGTHSVRQTLIERGLENAEHVECIRTIAPAPPLTSDSMIVLVGIDRLSDGAGVRLEAESNSKSEKQADKASGNGGKSTGAAKRSDD